MHAWYSHGVYVLCVCIVCMYGKILTSILRIDVYMPSGPACDWVYMCCV